MTWTPLCSVLNSLVHYDTARGGEEPCSPVGYAARTLRLDLKQTKSLAAMRHIAVNGQ